MRIAIKATHITSGGGLTHLNKIIEWFGKLAPEAHFNLIGKSGQERLFIIGPANFEYSFYEEPARNLASQLVWERRKLPDIIGRLRADLLFEPGNYGTLLSPCPKISLIHNLAPFDKVSIQQARLYQKLRLTLLRDVTIKSIRSSQGVIFLSKFAEEVISKYVDLSSKKTTILYHGIPDSNNFSEDRTVIKKFNIPSEFILCVSHVYRYKNLLELVQGYIKASQIGAGLPSLIVAGAKYDVGYMKRIDRAVSRSGFGDRIKFIGSVDEIALGTLYRNCKYFVFPSALENCPNILLEALGHGCAVLSSDKGVMPEICDDSALYFDPFNKPEIAYKLRLLNFDSMLLKNLRDRARERSRYFGWEKTARGTLQFFDRILDGNHASQKMNKIGELIGK